MVFFCSDFCADFTSERTLVFFFIIILTGYCRTNKTKAYVYLINFFHNWVQWVKSIIKVVVLFKSFWINLILKWFNTFRSRKIICRSSTNKPDLLGMLAPQDLKCISIYRQMQWWMNVCGAVRRAPVALLVEKKARRHWNN